MQTKYVNPQPSFFHQLEVDLLTFRVFQTMQNTGDAKREYGALTSDSIGVV